MWRRWQPSGARVVVTDIEDTSGAVGAIKAQGGEAIGMITDVTSDDSLEEMVRRDGISLWTD